MLLVGVAFLFFLSLSLCPSFSINELTFSTLRSLLIRLNVVHFSVQKKSDTADPINLPIILNHIIWKTFTGFVTGIRIHNRKPDIIRILHMFRCAIETGSTAIG